MDKELEDNYSNYNNSINYALVISPLQNKISKDEFEKILSIKTDEYGLNDYKINDFKNAYFSGNEFIFTANNDINKIQIIQNDLNFYGINSIIKNSSEINFNLSLSNRNIYFKDIELKPNL